MNIPTDPRPNRSPIIRTMLWRFSGVALLWCVAATAHAASIYQCVGAHGHVTFRDTPCNTNAQQKKLDVAGQPLIDPNAPRPLASMRESRPAAQPRTRRAPTAPRKQKQATSWECRAANGEVFYRHTRCPGSVPGDGVVRSGHAETPSRSRSRRRHDAWGRVSVHGVKIPRSEACRRIHAPSAAGRDGHQRDDTVPTYDRLMNRDPCTDA